MDQIFCDTNKFEESMLLLTLLYNCQGQGEAHGPENCRPF